MGDETVADMSRVRLLVEHRDTLPGNLPRWSISTTQIMADRAAICWDALKA